MEKTSGLNAACICDVAPDAWHARSPVGWGAKARTAVKLQGFEKANQLRQPAADVLWIHDFGHDDSFRVDHDGRALGRTLGFVQYPVRPGNLLVSVTDKRIAHVSHRGGDFGKHLVTIDAVRTDRQDLDAQLLELRVKGSDRCQFCRSDEGEIRRIEEQDNPPAAVVGEFYVLQLSVDKGFRFKQGGGIVAAAAVWQRLIGQF